MSRLSSDLELLKRWRRGDALAGNELFRRHFQAVYRFFRDKVSGNEDELIQATFFACVRARDQFREDCSFRAYLFTLARNELYQHIRLEARRGKLDFGVTSLADLGPSPSRVLDMDQQRAQLTHALRQLPLQQQLLIELHYWEDMRPAELAEIFEITQTTARVWLHRARQALRETLEGPQLHDASSTAGGEALATWAQALTKHRPSDDGHQG